MLPLWRKVRDAAASPWTPRLGTLAVGLTGTVIYAASVHHIYPVDTWLFWLLASIWGWVLLFSLACVSIGAFVLRRWMDDPERPPLESAVQAMAVGVVVFVMGQYVGGALGLYGPVFALALPVVLLAVGARDAVQLWRRFRAAARSDARRTGPWERAAQVGGVLAVGVIYLGLMTPDALNYDSAWSHLVIAQEYARAGRIIPFRGNYNMGVPHLASLIHTWGYTLPGHTHPAVRWMLVLHNEFALFLWTLSGVAAGIRRLVGRSDLRGAWAAFFLFPIIFVYDNNIGGASDHVTAFFAIPMLLATLDVAKRFGSGPCALLAVVSAGASLTKYQAVYIIAPIAAVLGVRAVGFVRDLRRVGGAEAAAGFRALGRAPVILVGLGTLLVAPHFIKNVVFHGNPVYPFAQELFPRSHPVVPGGPFLMRHIFTDDWWIPKGTPIEKLGHAFKLFATFSFDPHYSFTKNWPSFGSLFTLLLPLLFFLRNVRPIAIAAVIGSGSVLLWGYTYNPDRNLQVSMPLLVCVAGALLVRSWQEGRLARVGLLPLVAFQIVWGGDALFYSSHDRIRSSMDLIRSGFEGNAKTRLDGYRADFREVKASLPPDAVVLLHTSHIGLGIEREVIQDWQPYQGLLSYDALKTPREVYDLFRSLGVTHIIYYPRHRGASSKQEEVLFDAFITRWAEPVKNARGHQIMRMPDKPPPIEAPYRVATVGLGGYVDGIYPVQALRTHEYLPERLKIWATPEIPWPGDAAAQRAFLTGVDAVFVRQGGKLAPEVDALLRESFTAAITYPGHYTLLLKGKFGRSD